MVVQKKFYHFITFEKFSLYLECDPYMVKSIGIQVIITPAGRGHFNFGHKSDTSQNRLLEPFYYNDMSAFLPRFINILWECSRRGFSYIRG
jgi:hypothetical protein